MKARLKQLVSALAQLDADARKLVAAAAAEGNFEDVVELAPLAKDIATLAVQWSGDFPPTKATPIGNNDSGDDGTNGGPQPGRTSRIRPQKKNEYPQFVRERDELVKLGWSARDKKIYEHRVPRSAIDIVTRTVANKGKTGQRFSMDELLRAIAVKSGDDNIPSYQAYATVSWLKRNGMLLQHGRQGYTVVRPQTFNDSVQTAWQALKRR
jgi:hypothetical protein